ncbi:MAG TPA: AAA family ATPase [Oscillatoriales cyanobacterium M59_W2019_021]|nr:AAA family ATPase [Oscillatoriales cyanobacterium M4454_W2019_049]HIK51524.1 AAA family ATPase [Oscillatoriales cyanobacterium M59_W2019_021]
MGNANQSNFNAANRIPQNLGLLGAGWRPLHRELDWGYLWHLVQNDTGELLQKTLDVASDLANAVGRREYAWWSNLLNLFSENTRYEIDEFWNYITPDYSIPDYHAKQVLSIETPLKLTVNRNSIPIDYALDRLLEMTVLKILEILGRPDSILQFSGDRAFSYPVERFTDWDRLQLLDTIYAYWHEPEVWLTIRPSHSGEAKVRLYTLIARDLASMINKATYNLAVMLSGYQNRIGQVRSQYPIRSFPADIQQFTDTVGQAIFDRERVAILVRGVPGTGKTAWTQAVAQEILVPLGYVIFILDRDAVENFVPPSYLERICLIVNEADNLAQNRATEVAQRSSTTEHILSLLDGTLYQSVIEDRGTQASQKLVVLLTCNTTERLDPAMLRKGRIDFIGEFYHQFV